MKILKNFDCWAGTEKALENVLALQGEYTPAQYQADIGGSEENLNAPVRRYQLLEDGTAVLELKGSFLNVDLPDWVEDFFGVRGYPGMQRDFQQLSEDPEVKRVVLDVDSGGGHVSGIYDTSKSLDSLRNVKPVATYTSDSMYSAAYWLGANADRIGMAPMAGVGSIGVLLVHQDYTDAFKNEGVTVTVLRSVPNKALGTPYERLTDAARASLEKEMGFYHDHFVGHISQARGIPVATLNNGIADGKTYLGQEAIGVGLADVISDFESFVSDFSAATPVVDEDNLSGGSPTFQHGVNSMTLEEALAEVTALQGQITEKEATLAQAQADCSKLSKQLEAETAAKEALAERNSALQADVTAYEAELDKRITALATAMNVEFVPAEDLTAKKALAASMQAKFDEKFPGGQVSHASANQPSAGAEQPAWLQNLVNMKGK